MAKTVISSLGAQFPQWTFLLVGNNGIEESRASVFLNRFHRIFTQFSNRELLSAPESTQQLSSEELDFIKEYVDKRLNSGM